MKSKADRYGWKVSNTEELTEEELALERRESEVELRREEKWVRMFSQWELFSVKHESKLNERIFKGIPDALRGRAWQLLLDPNSSEEIRFRPTVASLVAMGRRPSCDTIDVDLKRTLPKMIMFSDPAVRESLKSILYAYVSTDPDLGYVQGMGFTAAMLLSYLDEASAFWCFVKLMAGEKHAIRRLYFNSFEGLNTMNTVWDLLLAERFKKVAENLKACNVVPALYTTSWFLTSFMNVDFHPALRMMIFDRLAAFGYRAVLSFALVIIALHEDALSTGTTTQCIVILQRPEKSEKFADWRSVVPKYNKSWISAKEYERLFRTLAIPLFGSG
jgi:hypothetical protein